MPESFKKKLKFPTTAPLSPVHWVAGGRTETKPFNKTKSSNGPTGTCQESLRYRPFAAMALYYWAVLLL